MRFSIFCILPCLLGGIAAGASAAEIQTNSVSMTDAPKWLTGTRVDRVVERIQSILEWDIRKTAVKWYRDQAGFRALHGFDDSVLAFSRKTDNTIHVGPRVDSANFDQVFGHELVHIILYQKYREAIPIWLEEGLAAYLAKQLKVDYKWLAAQPEIDVRTMSHPFRGTPQGARYHYMASTALIEMIADKCELDDLLQLSVGSRLEAFLATYCELIDINLEFRKWLKKKS